MFQRTSDPETRNSLSHTSVHHYPKPERSGRVANTPALCLEISGFKTRPGEWLSWHVLRGFPSTSVQILGYYFKLGNGRLLQIPSNSSPLIIL
jgi:hypothetical protein